MKTSAGSMPTYAVGSLNRYVRGTSVRPARKTTNVAAPSPLFGTASTDYSRSAYDYSPGPPEAVDYFRKAMGDDNLDDVISGSETLKDAAPVLLLSRGPYKVFSDRTKLMTNFSKCDEISNVTPVQ